jgi:hypothetical protein
MRAADLARLNELYPEAMEPTEADAMAAIGVKQPHWASLESEIFADFIEQQPYGIGWWAPGPGTSRRILIADHLSCCLASVAGNITEASLHWLEYLDASDRDSARLASAVKILPSGPFIDPPRPRCPSEQLAPDFVRMHQAGLIRGIASALDCLAGVIIGVAALPQSILKADFKQARAVLARVDGTASAGAEAQADFAAQLEAAIAAAGPLGWLDWTLDLRNMLSTAATASNWGSICRSRLSCWDRTAIPHPALAAFRICPAILGARISRSLSTRHGTWSCTRKEHRRCGDS